MTGPVYEIVAVRAAPGDGDRLMRVRVVETGGELDYRLTDILDDPSEHESILRRSAYRFVEENAAKSKA